MEPERGPGLRLLRFTAASGAPARRELLPGLVSPTDTAEGSFSCYASVYDVEYRIGGGFFSWLETISRDAFTASIARQERIPVHHEHNWDAAPIGDARARSDDHGLLGEGGLYTDLGDYVQRIYRSMQAGALREWSVAFYAEEITTSKDRPELDVIDRADLAEISVCVRGANPNTETLQLNKRGLLQLFPADDVARRRARESVDPSKRAPGDGSTPEEIAGQIEDLLDQFTAAVTDPGDAQDLLSTIHDAEENLLEKVAGGGSSSASAARMLELLTSPNPSLRDFAREALSSQGAT